MNIAVMECYFLRRPFDEEGKPIRGYRKRMNNRFENTGFGNNRAKAVWPS